MGGANKLPLAKRIKVLHTTDIELPKNKPLTYECSNCTVVGNYTATLWDLGVTRRAAHLIDAVAEGLAIVRPRHLPDRLPALAKAVAAVKRFAPGKLAYINLYPNYATIGAPNLSQLGTDSYADYLERFIAEQTQGQVQQTPDLQENGISRPAAAAASRML